MSLTTTVRNWSMAVLAVLLGAVAMSIPTSAQDPAGSQGLDTSLPLTESAVTVSGRGQFSDLRLTVNQTKELTNQAISITWEGGTPTLAGAGRFAGHYLQFMQCWGDDDGTNPENPGPPPEQCVQGAVAGTYGGLPGTLYPVGFALTRIISRSTWANFDPDVGFLEASSTNVWRPFRSVDGTVVNAHTDPSFNPSIVGGNFWQNPYFDIVTTNEIAGGVTRSNGTGAELFQVLTGVQSSGLGCGQRVLSTDGGQPRVPNCWLVVVPRGAPADENAGTPFESNADQVGVATSPVAPAAWANRIAVPLEFSPVDSPCRLGDDERQILGNELALAAVASWQPALCGERQLPPFSYAPGGDQIARRQLVNPGPGSPGMVVVNKPVRPGEVDPDSPVFYFPLTASGLVIGFNIERVPNPTAPASAQQISGIRVSDLNLTPRLVAKLLTQSYFLAVRIIEPPPYDWIASNPAHLGDDPDFLRFNPEFDQLNNSDRNFATLALPAGNSDAAEQIWEWVLSDPEAKAWMDGQEDEWGMQVNPAYSTNAALNPAGFAFGEPLPPSFPKADPYCYRSAPIGPNGSIVPPPLCGTDWSPYARSFEEAATMTRAAYDRARNVPNPFAINESNAWSRSEPQFLGFRTFLSVTDTSSAQRYGVQMARLSRAGDNGSSRTFVAPDSAGLTAGLDSMKEREVPGVRLPSVTEQSPNAYPLTTLTYAALAPVSLELDELEDYLEFIAYAWTDGQQPGTALGRLPVGYLPLPQAVIDEALAAFPQIGELPPVPAAPPPTTTTPPPVPEPTVAPPTAASPSSPPPTVDVGAVQNGPAAAPRPTAGSRASTATTTTTSPSTDTTTPVEEEAAPAPAEEPVAAEVVEPDPAAVATPSQDVGPVRFAVPIAGSMALASCLLALELTKRPRRLPSALSPGAVTA